MDIEKNLVQNSSRRSAVEVHVNINVQQTIWKQIISETEAINSSVEGYKKILNPEEVVPLSPPMQYIETKLFHVLRTALEDTLDKAINTESLICYRSTFNGLDYLAELLWNRNPTYPRRHKKYVYIYDMDWVIEYLNKEPRPYFPLSWIFTKEIAAKVIQRVFRAYLVRKREDVQEMRQFWKALKQDTNASNAGIENELQSVHIDLSRDYRDDPYPKRYTDTM